MASIGKSIKKKTPLIKSLSLRAKAFIKATKKDNIFTIHVTLIDEISLALAKILEKYKKI